MNLETKITIYKFTPQLFTLNAGYIDRKNELIVVVSSDGRTSL